MHMRWQGSTGTLVTPAVRLVLDQLRSLPLLHLHLYPPGRHPSEAVAIAPSGTRRWGWTEGRDLGSQATARYLSSSQVPETGPNVVP